MEKCLFIVKIIFAIILICLLLLLLDYFGPGIEGNNSYNGEVSQRWTDSKGYAPSEGFLVEGIEDHNSSRSNERIKLAKFERFGPKRILDNPDADISYRYIMG